MVEFGKRWRERRSHPRTKIRVPVRYTLAGQDERIGTIVEVSFEELVIAGPEVGVRGEEVAVYSERIGRIEGKIARLAEGGFVMKLSLPAHSMEVLMSRLGVPQGAG